MSGINYGQTSFDEEVKPSNINYDYSRTSKQREINYTPPAEVKPNPRIKLTDFIGNANVESLVGKPTFNPGEITLYGPWTEDGVRYYVSYYIKGAWKSIELDESEVKSTITVSPSSAPPADTTNKIYSLQGELYYNGKSVDKSFSYEQSTPSELWVIPHPLNKKPSVVVTDSTGRKIEWGYVQYISNNEINIEFGAPFSGRVELN